MKTTRQSWRDTFRAVGVALVDVVRAEAAVVGETWKFSGRELGKILGFAVALAYLALICLPTLLLFALLMGLSEGLEWPLWAAALTVAAVVVVVAFVLLRIIRHRIRHRLESPAATVRQRFADHRAWWNERIADGGAVAEGSTTDAATDSPVADPAPANARADGSTDQDPLGKGDRNAPIDTGD